MKAKRAVVTAGGALALTALVVTIVLLRPSDGADSTAPTVPPGSAGAPGAPGAPTPTTTTTIYKPTTYIGAISLRLATDAPGTQTVRLVWAPNARRFEVDGGKPVVFCFEKRDPITPDIVVSSTVHVDVTLGDGCPTDHVDANWGWTG